MRMHFTYGLLLSYSIKCLAMTTLLAVLPSSLCCNARQMLRLEGSEKTAWMMYQDKATFEMPGNRGSGYLHEVGREAYLSDMIVLTGTKYNEEAIYCIGLLGDRRHVALVASKLDDHSQKTRDVAVGALAKLTGEEFGDVSAAKKWWETHEQLYPPLQQRK